MARLLTALAHAESPKTLFYSIRL